MQLRCNDLLSSRQWEEAGVHIPSFSREDMKKKTAEAPVWVHFGAGNLFRAFPAALQQKLLETGKASCGIVAADTFDRELVQDVLRRQDGLSLLVTMKKDGSLEKTVIASVAETLWAGDDTDEDWQELLRIFQQPSLQMVTSTVTEKGYAFSGPGSLADRVARLLRERYLHGAAPLALLSLDNCSHNGEKFQKAVWEAAQRLQQEGLAEPEFLEYLQDPSRISFPWSMIDKITPHPDASVQKALLDLGLNEESCRIFRTEKGTCTAAFVNAEEAQYLVVEDNFPGGRPALEQAGVLFTDRATVEKTERMKVCICLNPLHTALAVFGCLLGYTRISQEMQDPLLVKLVERLGFVEGMPVVTDPGVLHPEAFLRDVLYTRLPNPYLPDTPQRIAADTSQKLPIRFGETLKAYLAAGKEDLSFLKGIPLVFAGWCRYLLGVDDKGNDFAPSPDLRLEEMQQRLQGIRIGEAVDLSRMHWIFSDASLFGVDLYKVGLGEPAEKIFVRMAEGPGAVRKVLEESLKQD